MPAMIQPDQLALAAQQALPKVMDLLAPFLQLDFSVWPFWLGLLSLPFGLFEMYAKQMMDELNGIVQALVNVSKVGLVLWAFSIGLGLILVIGGYGPARLAGAVDMAKATEIIYTACLIGLGLLGFWLTMAICRLVSHGSYITGACFIMTLISVYIEVIDEFGQQGLYGFIGGLAVAVLFWVYKLRQIQAEAAKPQRPETTNRIPLRDRLGQAPAQTSSSF